MCVAGCFPALPALFAAAVTSAISSKAPLIAQESRVSPAFVEIERVPKLMRMTLVCAGQQTGSQPSNASPPGTS